MLRGAKRQLMMAVLVSMGVLLGCGALWVMGHIRTSSNTHHQGAWDITSVGLGIAPAHDYMDVGVGQCYVSKEFINTEPVSTEDIRDVFPSYGSLRWNDKRFDDVEHCQMLCDSRPSCLGYSFRASNTDCQFYENSAFPAEALIGIHELTQGAVGYADCKCYRKGVEKDPHTAGAGLPDSPVQVVEVGGDNKDQLQQAAAPAAAANIAKQDTLQKLKAPELAQDTQKSKAKGEGKEKEKEFLPPAKGEETEAEAGGVHPPMPLRKREPDPLENKQQPASYAGYVFVGIESGCNYLERRNLWRKSRCPEMLKAAGIEYKFFIGAPMSTSFKNPMEVGEWPTDLERDMSVNLTKEAEQYGDVVILPYRDLYHDLSYKTMMVLQYGLEHSNADWIIEMDDDICVPPHELIPQLAAAMNKTKYIFCGAIFWNGHNKGTAGAMNYSAFYWSGNTVVSSRPLVEIIMGSDRAHSLLAAPYGITSEDCTYGKWVRWAYEHHAIDLRVLSLTWAAAVSVTAASARYEQNKAHAVYMPGARPDKFNTVIKLEPYAKVRDRAAEQGYKERHKEEIIEAAKLNAHSIQFPSSTRCVDVQSGIKKKDYNGNKLILWDCGGRTKENQRFTLQDGVIKWPPGEGSHCVDVPDGKIHDGAKLHLWKCNDDKPHNPNQRFSYNKTSMKIVLEGHNMCLDGTNPQPGNGQQLELWKCNPQSLSQKWLVWSKEEERDSWKKAADAEKQKKRDHVNEKITRKRLLEQQRRMSHHR